MGQNCQIKNYSRETGKQRYPNLILVLQQLLVVLWSGLYAVDLEKLWLFTEDLFSLLTHGLSYILGCNIQMWMFLTLVMKTTALSREPYTLLIDHMTRWILGALLISYITKLDPLTLLITLIPPYLITRHKLPLMLSKKISQIFIFMKTLLFSKHFGEFARDVQLLKNVGISGSGKMRD